MIRIENVDKYFNKGKKNEIHVIDHTTLELPTAGLVCLFGPSGSGKTTLLNVLGGLDSAKGSIRFNDTLIESYNMHKWDDIRNKEIGYIFQNYMLLEDVSIYENIKLTLNMIGITDKVEINNRVEYLLNAVGLKNYKKRKAGLLSGGQQQRVAIARALAKNPSVIIADEPTGNLDSKNTVEVMNIIKQISKTKLVLLVTHEQNIANFYADRIIELKDGKIVEDRSNVGDGTLDLKHDSDIYLKDLNQSEMDSDQIHLDLFADHSDLDKLNLRLVIKNGTVYLDFDRKKFKKVTLLEEHSALKLIDAHYQDFNQDNKNELSTFDFEHIIDNSKMNKKQPVITFKHAITLAFNKIVNMSNKRIFLFIGYMLAGFLLLIAQSLLWRILTIDDSMFIEYDKNYVEITNVVDRTKLFDLIDSGDIEFINFGVNTYISTYYELPTVYQSYWINYPTVTIEMLGAIHDTDITQGRNVLNDGEILLDYSMFEGNYNQYVLNMKAYGISSPSYYLGKEMTLGNKTYTLVGFVNRGFNQVIMSESDYYKQVDLTGTITQNRIFLSNGYSQYSTYMAYSSDPKTLETKANEVGMSATWQYPVLKENFQRNMALMYSIFFVIIGVIVGVIWLSLFFIQRTSLSERKGEISVFRALGVKRFDILKVFMIEILVITILSFFIGYVFGYYYFKEMNTTLYDLKIINLALPTTLLSLLFIFIINQLVGLIPVFGLLRKTPSQIMSEYDA